MERLSDIHMLADRLSYEAGNLVLQRVIEKELLHHDILEALLDGNLLDECTFQGGTCLRLCHGSPRYSEDLDFAVDSIEAMKRMGDLPQRLESAFVSKYSEPIGIHDPAIRTPGNGNEIAMKRWELRIRLVERKDLPMQRIKLEVAGVPSYTGSPLPIRTNYSQLTESQKGMSIRAESLEEICADKAVSFVMSAHPRWRDIWDLRWIKDQPGFDAGKALSFVTRKIDDYHCVKTFPGNLRTAMARLPKLVEDARFQETMGRLLDPADLEATVRNPAWRHDTVEAVQETLASAEYAMREDQGSSLDEVMQECSEWQRAEKSTQKGERGKEDER